MESLRKQAAKILREKKKYKVWLTAFLCMAVLVTAGTVAALTMSGQALTKKEKVLICGTEAHQHTEECRNSEGELVCGRADYVVHVHNDDCKDEDGNLVCALPERMPHVHDAACFAEQEVLVCGLEETQGHQHDEECYTKVQGELTCGQDGTGHQHGAECYTKVQGELTCGQDGAGHQHGAECYTKVQGELTCTSTEEGHEHGEGCYAWSEELTCGLTEEAHTHTDECYAWSEELTCGLTEEAHEHTDECYAWSEELTCETAEGEEAHTHTDECYTTETVNICGELELHTHDGSCYGEDGSVICGKMELLEHVHGEDCFEVVVPEEEEEAQLFQKTYEDAEIRVVAEYDETANIPEEAQLVAERIETEDEEDTQGVSGAEPKAEEVQEPQETDEADSSQAPAESEGAEEGIEPLSEDVAAPEGEETADTETEAPSEDEEAKDSTEPTENVKTVTEEVSYRLRFLMDGEEIEPEGTVTFTVWDLAEEDSEPQIVVYQAGDGLEKLVVVLTRTVVVELDVIRKTYEDDKVKVVAEYTETANIPDEAELIAKPITAESNLELYAEYEEKFKEALADENAALNKLYDIGFYVDGEEIEPEDKVTIMIQFLDEEGLSADEPVATVHFAESGTEVMTGSQADEEGFVSFETNSFSPFGFTNVIAGVYGNGYSTRSTGIPVYVFENGEWTQAGQLTEGTTEDYIFASALTDMLSRYGYDYRGFGVDARWIAYTTDGDNVTTAECVQHYMFGWVWKLGANASEIKGIYYLPGNMEYYSGPISEYGKRSCTITFNPGNGNGKKGRIQYGNFTDRVEAKISNSSGKTVIYLPSDAELSDVGQEAKHVLFRDAGTTAEVSLKYSSSAGEPVQIRAGERIAVPNERNQSYAFKLVGWYDIVSGDYYDVSNGRPYELQVDFSHDYILYADWIAESYDFKDSGTVVETEDTSDFVTTHVYDYNELFNVYSAGMSFGVDDKTGLRYEEWGDTGKFKNTSLPSLIFKDSDGTVYGYLDVTAGLLGNVTKAMAWNGVEQKLHAGMWPDKTVIDYLFPGNSDSYGVHYVGKGNYLFQHVVEGDDKIGYYIYDSNNNAASYQQSENRFYVYDKPQKSPVKENNSYTPGFFPFNGSGDLNNYDSCNNQINYYFGMSTEINFYLPGDSGSSETVNQVDGKHMKFEFSGDDDVWVFLEDSKGDEQLVLDLGGIHGRQEGTIDFTTGKVEVNKKETNEINFKAGSYKMTIYYLERGSGGSNCMIKFNIVPRYKLETATAAALTATKTWKNTNTVPSEFVEFALYRKANTVKWEAEDKEKLREKLGYTEAEFETYKQAIEAELAQNQNLTKVGDSIKLATNGIEDVSYTWEGLSPYFDYEVTETNVPGYTTRITKGASSSSRDYWVETSKLEESKEVVILNKEGSQALADKDGKLTTEPMRTKYGILLTSDQKDDNGIVQRQGIIPSEAVWIVEKGRLRNKASGSYLVVDKNGLTINTIGTELKIGEQLGEGLCDDNYRVVYTDNRFTAMSNTGNDNINANTDAYRVRVYTMQNVVSEVYNWTVTNTYTPSITIQKVDSKSDKVIEVGTGEEAKFTLTRITEGVDGAGNATREYAYYDGETWRSAGADVETLVNADQYWFSLEGSSKSVAEFPNGNYTLTEREAPTGYKLPNEGQRVITFDIEAGGIINLQAERFEDGETVIAEVDERNNLLLYVRNEKEAASTVEVAFYKYTGNNVNLNPLEGATFDLYRLWTAEDDKQESSLKPETIDGKRVVKIADEKTSNEVGLFHSAELACGTYYLKETDAPDGYNMLSGMIEIKVEEVTSSTNPAEKKINVSIDEDKTPKTVVEAVENEGKWTIRVFNTYGIALPETGSIGTQPYTIGGAALVTATVLLMYGFSMRRKKNERRSTK